MAAFLNQTTHRMLLRYHPQVGHLFVPNLRARLTNELGGYTVRTNGWGFRSNVEYRKERGDRPRILAFGDSTMAGDNGPNEIRYSDMLAEQLGAEVYNFGISGTGTDQHLLAYREVAKDIEADLVILAVQLDAIRRVQATARESIDRTTGRRIMVPKPYFTLEGGELELHNVPVPKTRPDAPPPRDWRDQGSFVKKQLWSLAQDPRLNAVRSAVRRHAPRVQSEIYRIAGFQPYPDYLSEDTPGWQLLEAILRLPCSVKCASCLNASA